MSKKLDNAEDFGSSACYLPNTIRLELIELNFKIKTLLKVKRLLIEKTCRECEHPLEAIRECQYEKLNSGGCLFPWLICTECGYTEEGWGSGYTKLLHAAYAEVPKISRNGWQQLSTVKLRQHR